MNVLARNIINWHKEIDRDLPWKHTEDPYFIWLSEIIMQQTRIAQGIPYYLKFVSLFPTVHDLANASQEEVYKAWEGLGYYSRARNLHKTAKIVSLEMEGVFPADSQNLLKLPGIGPYTAAAIASFAYNEDSAVLDGNVFRVLSRLFDIDLDILSSKGKKVFQSLADEILPKGQSAIFNQAMMDFGALKCIPRNPACNHCPIIEQCEAFANGVVQERPVKKKPKPKRKRYFHFLDVSPSDIFLVQQRDTKDIWNGLYQFPLIETMEADSVEAEEWTKHLELQDVKGYHMACEIDQVLSHQRIFAKFYRAKPLFCETSRKNQVGESASKYYLQKENNVLSAKQSEYQKVPFSEISQFAFPKIINSYFQYLSENQ